MSKHDQIFKQLRQLPPEMSEEEVWEIIKILPTLPPPKINWITQISSNQIIMNTINIIAFVSSMLVFNSSEVTKYPLAPENNSQISSLVIDQEGDQEDIITPTENISITADSPQSSTLAPIPIETWDNSLALLMDDWIEEEGQSMEESTYLPLPSFSSPALIPTEDNFTSQSKANREMFAFITDPNYEPKLTPSSEKTKDKPKSKEKNKGKKVTKTTEVFGKPKNWKKAKKNGGGRPYQLSCSESFPKGIETLLPLKRKLRQEVKADALFGANKPLIRFSFDGPYILFNQRRIPAQLQNKYMDMINKYEITPCDIRMVEITNDYIAAGDITPEGFKGHMTGRVLIDNLNNVPISSLRPKNGRSQVETRQIEDFHSLVIDGLAVVHLSQGKSNTATVDVTGMPIQDLTTKVKDGVLSISTKGKHNGESIKVEISAERLESILVKGASELYSKAPVIGDDLFIKVADVGSAWLEVDTKKVRIEMSGGDLFISGKTDRQSLVTAGKSAHKGTFDNSRLTITDQ